MHLIVKKIIDQIMPFRPEKIILFGSYAYGRPGPDSDVDLLIVKRTKKTFRERNIEARLLIETPSPIDIFVLTPEEFEKYKTLNPFIGEIAEHGKVVYG